MSNGVDESAPPATNTPALPSGQSTVSPAVTIGGELGDLLKAGQDRFAALEARLVAVEKALVGKSGFSPPAAPIDLAAAIVTPAETLLQEWESRLQAVEAHIAQKLGFVPASS